MESILRVLKAENWEIKSHKCRPLLEWTPLKTPLSGDPKFGKFFRGKLYKNGTDIDLGSRNKLFRKYFGLHFSALLLSADFRCN